MFRAKTTIISIVSLIMLMVLGLSACGGGGSTATQQPGGQSQPMANPPDSNQIQAIFDDQAMAFTMIGAAGAALANANIVIEDPQSFVATTTADASGAFVINQSDVPPNFMTAPGTQIGVMQFTADTARSNPAYVTITLPDGSVP